MLARSFAHVSRLREKSGAELQRIQRLLWIATSVAITASVFAIYFGLQAEHERSRAISSGAELKAKEDELSARGDELARIKSVVADAPAVPPPVIEAATTPTAAPTASISSTLPPEARASLRNMTRQTHLAMLRPIYGALLAQLLFTPAKRERFYELQLMVDDPGLNFDKLPQNASSLEEHSQIQAQIQQTRDSALQQIKELFGTADYDLYDRVHSTQSERTLIQQFRQQVDPGALQISDWQYDRLRDLLIQARPQYPAVGDDLSASHEVVMTQAAYFLTPEQLAAFRDYLHNHDELGRAVRKLYPPGG